MDEKGQPNVVLVPITLLILVVVFVGMSFVQKEEQKKEMCHYDVTHLEFSNEKGIFEEEYSGDGIPMVFCDTNLVSGYPQCRRTHLKWTCKK